MEKKVEKKTVLILGNGFDLDLGLKTSYRDFLQDKDFPFKDENIEKFFPFNKSYNGLGSYLAMYHTVDLWVDVEELLYKYVLDSPEEEIKKIESTIKSLETERDLAQNILNYMNSSGESSSETTLETERDLAQNTLNYMNSSGESSSETSKSSLTSAGVTAVAGLLAGVPIMPTLLFSGGLLLGTGLIKKLFSSDSDKNFSPEERELSKYPEERELSKYLDDRKSLIEENTKLHEVLQSRNEHKPQRFWYIDYFQYCDLRLKFMEYLKKIQEDDTDETYKPDSTASRLMVVLAETESLNHIYSFNYTSLETTIEKIAKKINKSLSQIPACEYVHGSIEEKNIILGIGDNQTEKKNKEDKKETEKKNEEDKKNKFDEKYDFLYKSFSPFFKSHSIHYAISDAAEVIFFGMSFGDSDKHYFLDFFKKQARCDMKESEKKRIVIFTKDYMEEMKINRFLKNELRDDYVYLKTNNDFRILTTAKDEFAYRTEDYFKDVLGKYGYDALFPKK